MLLTSYFHHQKGILVSLLLLYLSALTPPTTFLVGAEPNPHYCETENGNGTVCKTQVSIFRYHDDDEQHQPLLSMDIMGYGIERYPMHTESVVVDNSDSCCLFASCRLWIIHQLAFSIFFFIPQMCTILKSLY